MGTIATVCKDDFKPNRCKSVSKSLYQKVDASQTPINKGFLTTSKPNTTIRTPDRQYGVLAKIVDFKPF